MIVVSNSSPLVSLSAVGHLDLLRDPYGTIIIPRAVYHEVEHGAPHPGTLRSRRVTSESEIREAASRKISP